MDIFNLELAAGIGRLITVNIAVASLTMILLAALLCNYDRGKCLIIIGTEGYTPTPNVLFSDSWHEKFISHEQSEVYRRRAVKGARILTTSPKMSFKRPGLMRHDPARQLALQVRPELL
jgi:hypothetical protein